MISKSGIEHICANIEMSIEDVEYIRTGAAQSFNHELADFLGHITANLRQSVSALRADSKPKKKRATIKLAVDNVRAQ